MRLREEVNCVRSIHQLTLALKFQEAVQKKEQYLQEAKADRQQLETSMRQVSDWLRGAEELLDSGIDGLDYSSVDQTLSDYTVSVCNGVGHLHCNAVYI